MVQGGTTILVVDDDRYILRLGKEILEEEGFRVVTASSGQECIGLLEEEEPSLVILDVNLPGMDGFTVCARIRESSHLPIIMVTARDDDEDKIRGFEVGADDYVVKPFSPPVLVARVNAVLRRATGRTPGQHDTAVLHFGELSLDLAAKRTHLNGRELILSGTEFRLLAYLGEHAGRYLTPDQILENVWGEEYIGEMQVLRVAIGRLRGKLNDDARAPRYILTRSVIGYSLAKP